MNRGALRHPSFVSLQNKLEIGSPRWAWLPWLAAAAVLPWLIQAAPAWRDGPEFVASAWGLGIAHPAGYPLYQSLVWAAEQLPLGDVAMRNHAFSALFTLMASVLLYKMALAFLRLFAQQDAAMHHPLAAWVTLCWLVMPSQIENAIQSEAYSLFACFTFLVMRLLFDFFHTGENRRYTLAVFLAGVGCGNHVMLGALLFPFLFALGKKERVLDAARLAFGGLAAGLAGLMVYAYLPVRSMREPSFDWGNPETLMRFWIQVSDQKNASAHWGTALSNSDAIFAHLEVLLDWFGTLGLVLLLFGWIWLFLRRPRLAWLAGSSMLFLFAFFLGWTSNTVLTGALGLLLLGGCIPLLILLGMQRGRRLAKGLALALAGAMFLHLYGAGVRFLAVRSDYLPSELVRTSLLSLPYRATVLAGPAWFHLVALQDIEGLRPDVTVVGLGDIISPQFFRPLRPWHVPLLRFPSIQPPDTGELSDREKAIFFKELLFRNADRSRFYLDMDEDYVHVFFNYIQAQDAQWWAMLATHPVRNDCRRLGENLKQALGRMLQEPQAISDPQFGLFLQYGYFSWFKVAMERQPRCLSVAKALLHWWKVWEQDKASTRPGALENDMGTVLARMGHLRGARVLFQLAEGLGSAEGAYNLGVMLERMGEHEKAMQQFRKTFIQYGDRKAFQRYRELLQMRGGT